MISFDCAYCGKPTEKEYRGSGTRPTMCSNACTVAAYKARHPERVAASRELQRAQYVPKVRASKPKRPPTPKLCACGRVSEKHKQLCEQCRTARIKISRQTSRIRNKDKPWARACKRAERARRKALHRVAKVETFDPIEVLERDRWRCHLCGVRTPKRLRGTYSDCAPELDHIIPLSVGGEHSRMNTACACRKCNIAKASRPLGQLRLAA